ncbi:MAG: NUDIX domain-containing protein [Candidatus Micrarchaeia archaeon]
MQRTTLKSVKREGITAILINKGKILTLKRRNFPFITNPGIWFFVTGGLKKNESYVSAVYRELEEETGIKRTHLRLIDSFDVQLFDKAKSWRWHNKCFIFYTNSRKIRLNIENSKFTWISLNDIISEKSFSNIFINKMNIINKIQGALSGNK